MLRDSIAQIWFFGNDKDEGKCADTQEQQERLLGPRADTDELETHPS